MRYVDAIFWGKKMRCDCHP